MAKPWDEKPLWWKVFLGRDQVYPHAGKIIGHLGCAPLEFFDAAKKLPDDNQYRYENAMRDLTVYAAREASPPRYELRRPHGRCCRSFSAPRRTIPSTERGGRAA